MHVRIAFDAHRPSLPPLPPPPTPPSFFAPEALVALNAAVDDHVHLVQHTPRSSFLRGVAAMEPLLDLPRLAGACSALVGLRVRPHALRREWTHINVQLHAQNRPVDVFHYDYVPFVFVTMLRKAPGDKTGELVLDLGEGGGGGNGGLLPVSLAVGESILLQGSHVRHQANQSLAGCRVSLVVSLMPASVLQVDITRVRAWGRVGGVGGKWRRQPITHTRTLILSLHKNRSASTACPWPKTRRISRRPWPIGQRGCGPFVSTTRRKRNACGKNFVGT